jgi:molybdopterin-guanine dinucleotide biosynthesis adapter protein
MSGNQTTPILGFAAYSGTGKTTLLVKLLPLLTRQNIRIAIIKHAHHTFEIDHEGKDSYKLRKAGAQQLLIGSENRWALLVENYQQKQYKLGDFIDQIDHDSIDLVLVEGFKPVQIPKIELVRPALGNPLFYPDDKSVIAIATDAQLPVMTSLPVLDINNPEQIADFIINEFLPDNNLSVDTGT